MIIYKQMLFNALIFYFNWIYETVGGIMRPKALVIKREKSGETGKWNCRALHWQAE